MKIGFARLFTNNCDIKHNFKKIEKLYKEALESKLDIIIFPRLSVSGFSVNDKFLNDKFLEEVLLYFEKIIDLTIENQTKILIGSIYYEKNYIENNNIFDKILKDSAFFLDNGYIDSVIFRKEIDKLNILYDYKYFDKNNFLKYFNFNKKKFAVLLSDDIFSNFNIFLTSDNKPDYVICLDSSIKDINYKKKHLIKLAKFVNAPVFYINNATKFNNHLFKGELILINEDFDVLYADYYKDDELFDFEVDCEDGTELFIKNKKVENKSIYPLLKKCFNKNNIILDHEKFSKTEINDIKKNTDKYKIITFENKKINNVDFVDVKKFINIEIYNSLDDIIKEVIKSKITDLYILE